MQLKSTQSKELETSGAKGATLTKYRLGAITFEQTQVRRKESVINIHEAAKAGDYAQCVFELIDWYCRMAGVANVPDFETKCDMATAIQHEFGANLTVRELAYVFQNAVSGKYQRVAPHNAFRLSYLQVRQWILEYSCGEFEDYYENLNREAEQGYSSKPALSIEELEKEYERLYKQGQLAMEENAQKAASNERKTEKVSYYIEHPNVVIAQAGHPLNGKSGLLCYLHHNDHSEKQLCVLVDDKPMLASEVKYSVSK